MRIFDPHRAALDPLYLVGSFAQLEAIAFLVRKAQDTLDANRAAVKGEPGDL